MPVSLHFLIVASETPDQAEARRRSVGAASHETYASTVRSLAGGASIDFVSCVDGSRTPSPAELRRYDGIFFAGSPIQMHDDSGESRSAARFATDVFESGTPAFGSCAGLQIAAVAAGGTCKPRETALEAGFARGITATDAGRDHPLLRGRPIVWDAPAMHFSVIDTMPPGGVVLARTKSTPIEAAEIRSRNGMFWGVQYHPELTVAEIAASLRRQVDDLIAQDMARDGAAIESYAALLDELHDDAARRDIAWRIGIDDEITDEKKRTSELRSFLHMLQASRS
ncbi:gamma-glutamyl-gamma-aminobutyrate hydrolase family protein (plasmid) [Skermanella sp. TT6]|uniref:Gamma-glutamyl-gamma-aminobutyrate hydrolase family protein n=1 Tax=Skermanella cutis TaxID=2775420 RepID=A0ABX7BEQ8_9PROT|nr:gamma-glutamyl-gamma-aminobutyrate hydrolase family protein [Skermanella sp. TT6]QQP92878.1 gamma-glutamyl-gamma-aminobutyrate hydrolase family protein [Skermanella sp. TT6]